MLSGGTDCPASCKRDTVRGIAEAKAALGPMEAFTRGILCNMLVCLAVWVSFAARSEINLFGFVQPRPSK